MRGDGSRFPVEVHSAGFEHQGEHCIVAVARDLSSRWQAESRYRLLMESIDKGVEPSVMPTLPPLSPAFPMWPQPVIPVFPAAHPKPAAAAPVTPAATPAAPRPAGRPAVSQPPAASPSNSRGAIDG